MSLATINPTLIKLRKLLKMMVLTGIWSPSGLLIAIPGRVELLTVRSCRLCVHRTAPSGVCAQLAFLGFTASISSVFLFTEHLQVVAYI